MCIVILVVLCIGIIVEVQEVVFRADLAVSKPDAEWQKSSGFYTIQMIQTCQLS